MTQNISVTSHQPVDTKFGNFTLTRGFGPKPLLESRIYFQGRRKGGKTTLISSCPDILILDWEHGADAVVGSKAQRFQPRSWDEWIAFKKALIAAAGAGQAPCRSICIDSGDKHVMMVDQMLLPKETEASLSVTELDWGRGYRKINSVIVQELDELHRAGYGWIFIGHTAEKTRKVGDKEVLVPAPSLTPSLIESLTPEVDLIMTIRKEIQVTVPEKTVTVGKRQMIIPDKENTRTDTSYHLEMSGTAAQGVEVGARVPYVGNVVLPQFDGWDVLETSYRDAIDRGQKADAESAISAPVMSKAK